jgi:hypothetical protein
MAESLKYLTKNVFVAGGNPEITYNPRDDRQLEAEVRSYLDQTGKAMSVSGPTKSGKTVLIERLLPSKRSIWMQGSDIQTIDSFWHRIVDWLGLYDLIEVSIQATDSGTGQASVSVGLPGVAQVTGSVGSSSSNTGVQRLTRQRNVADVAREGLTILPVPIVIDDFHYVPEDVKRDVARARPFHSQRHRLLTCGVGC